MSVIKMTDLQIERMGRELGDAYILITKAYLASAKTAAEMASVSKDPKIALLLKKLDKEIDELTLMYTDLGAE